MNKENTATRGEGTDKESSYHVELKHRMREYFDGGSEVTFEDIYAFVKEEALRSWKNGLEAGKKRAVQRPNRPSAYVKGSALATGRLRRVQPEV